MNCKKTKKWFILKKNYFCTLKTKKTLFIFINQNLFIMKKTLQLTICIALIAILGLGNLNAQKEKVRNPSFTNIKQTTITSNEVIVNDRGDGSPTYMLQNSANGSTIHKGTVANPYMPSSGSIGTNVQCLEYIDGVLYGVNWSGGNNFGKIDTETGTWTVIKSNFGSDGVALCWNPVDGNVYVSPWTSSDSENPVFGKVDLTTGNITTIATFPMTGENTYYMAIDNNGIAYAVNLGYEEFGTVDLTTGVFNAISEIDWDVNYISNLSIDRETNELYWAARGDGLDFGGGDLYSAYFKINKATGEMTQLYEDYNSILPQSFSILNSPLGMCDPASNLEVIYTNDCKAELTWDAPADNANATYNIYRDGAPIKQNHDQKSYTDEGFITTEGHTWSVKAVCQDGGLSDEISQSLSFCSCPPVVNLEANYMEDCSAELTWTAPAEGLKYNVYRGDDIIATEISTTTYIDETFENTGHTWKVKTVCADDIADDVTVTLPICELGINQNELTFSIVPNPAQNEIIISSERDYNTIEIINFLGQTVISQNATAQKTTIDVSQLMGGVYFVRIVSDNGTNVQKFVKK